MTMRNPTTKLAAAAIITVAAIAGIVMWTGTGSGITLANVLAQVQQITAYRFRATGTVSRKDATSENRSRIKESVLLISRDYGMKVTMDTLDPNGARTRGMEACVLFQEKAIIILRPDSKDYIHIDLDDAEIEKMRHQYYDPSSMLKEILGSKYESLGRSMVDGLEVEGFRAASRDYKGEVVDSPDVAVWVDVKTQLPVRLEMNRETDAAQVHVVVHNFQWNYPVNVDTFKLVIPADYTSIDELAGSEMMDGEGDIAGPKSFERDEEGAIAGLKVGVDLTGRYPEKLDLQTFSSLHSTAMKADPVYKRLQEDEDVARGVEQLLTDKELPIEERTKRVHELISKKREQLEKAMGVHAGETTDKVEPFLYTLRFYEMLAKEKKDPAYYGNVVTPQDADEVLMRWKVTDNQYRVIFGSLHAETVDAETLAELERNLPK